MSSARGGSSLARSAIGKSVKTVEKEEDMPNRGPDDEILAAALAGGNDCPPLEDLERVLNEGAPEPLKQHVDGCRHCQTELHLLRAFTSSEVAEQEKAAVSSIAAQLKSRSPEIIKPRARVDK